MTNHDLRGWWYALGTLCLLDLGTTWFALHHGREEANGIVLFLGWPLAIALKLAFVVLCLHAASIHTTPARTSLVLRAVVFIYCGVVVSNLIGAL